MRSVMSSMTSFWSGLSLLSTTVRSERAQIQEVADLKYLYSAFTKLPSLRLTDDHRAPLIRGSEEFPFETAVPLYSFKNIQQLEITDLDFRSFYGWDRLAEQLILLTLKRAHLDDPAEVLTDIVLDDADRRRRRSTKGGRHSPTVTPASSWTIPSTPRDDYARSHSDPGSPVPASPQAEADELHKDTIVLSGSASPKRPTAIRPVSSYRHSRTYSTKASRSGSGSSNSSDYSLQPHRADSSSSLLSMNNLAPSKWQRLKYLSLADNGLTSISAKSLAPVAATLRSLNLSSNLFTEVPDALASLTRLTSLDLSGCMISSLQSLTRSPLPAITTIKLKSNRLHSLVGVERLLSLENINVQDNGLTDPMEAARLTALPNLRRIWIKHNPFTKTHTSYRVKILNLFRQTPGYVEDMTIDDYGPGFAEKKQLVERVPEREPRGQPAVQIAETPVVIYSGRGPTENKELPETTKASTRRKRQSRRRIVDLAHDDTPWRPSPDITVVSRPSMDSRRSTDGATAGRDSISTDKGLNDHDSATTAPAPTLVSPGILAGAMEPSQNDQYRAQAEALRRELGSNWLSALDNQAWHNTHHIDIHNTQTMGHPPGLHRANTLVVTSGRTLG